MHHSEVYLGNVLPETNKLNYAMPLQIRAVSKLRIIKPKTKGDGVYKITSEQLSKIDNEILAMFTKSQ